MGAVKVAIKVLINSVPGLHSDSVSHGYYVTYVTVKQVAQVGIVLLQDIDESEFYRSFLVKFVLHKINASDRLV